jgi:hypothetical protein
MSKIGNSLGKPLSGIYSISSSLQDLITSSVITQINTGNAQFSNVTITGGSIDGVVIGGNNPGPITPTTITSGNSAGVGYTVCFYGTIIGDSACWLPTLGQWNIQGDLFVRDISDLGNLRINTNTITATNTNGNIILYPNGSGNLIVNSGITSSTNSGNYSFNTNSGNFNVTSNTSTLTTKGNTNISALNGNVVIDAGTSKPTYTISTISTGSTVSITTTLNNSLQQGDTVVISGSNNGIDGTYQINSVLSNTSFTIIPSVPVTTIGTTGTIQAQKNILLNADNYYISQNSPIIFGSPTNSTNFIVNNGTTTTIKSQDVVIDGNFTVHGTTTQSNVVTIDDPVFNVGGNTLYNTNDTMYRGIEFQYYNDGITNNIGFFGRNSTSGCFTYIPNAVETSPNVFTGTPGCATFGGLSATTLSISSTTTLSSLQTCNITCPSGNLNITSTNTSFSGNVVTTNISSSTGSVSIAGTTNVDNLNVTGTTTGITLESIQDKEHLSVSAGNNTNPSANTHITFINTSGTSSIYSITNIPSGSYNGNDVIITCTSPIVSGNSITIYGTGVIDGNFNVTSANGTSFTILFTGQINSAVIVGSVLLNTTGILSAPSVDGFEKKILCSSLTNLFSLKCPAGVLLDPTTGTTTQKFLDFEYAGQSVHLIYDGIKGYYIPLSANVCSHY